jgi:hypothetical protein
LLWPEWLPLLLWLLLSAAPDSDPELEPRRVFDSSYSGWNHYMTSAMLLYSCSGIFLIPSMTTFSA